MWAGSADRAAAREGQFGGGGHEGEARGVAGVGEACGEDARQECGGVGWDGGDGGDDGVPPGVVENGCADRRPVGSAVDGDVGGDASGAAVDPSDDAAASGKAARAGGEFGQGGGPGPRPG